MGHSGLRFGPLGRCLVAVSLVLALCVGCGNPVRASAFHFTVRDGLNLNYFLRDGASAAHLLLRSGANPRLVVAFPAGNSGTGLWFEPAATDTEWVLDRPPEAKAAKDARDRELHGIEFAVSIAAAAMAPRRAVLSNVRVLRDYDQYGYAPVEIATPPKVSGNSITWERDRLDGAAGYRLALEVTDGAVAGGSITAGPDGRIGLHVTALSGDTPLTPLTGRSLLNGAERPDDSAKNTLTFLSYREKFLAGSWRFNTYFGRDTLLSLRLLLPVLAPDAVEAGLRSVLARLGQDGTVAHEEAISEFAVLAHLRENGTRSDAPVFDYGMIDESYLLAPVAAAYLLDDHAGAQRAAGYLAADSGSFSGATASDGQALVRNLRLVAASATAFAEDPRYEHLIGLKPGHNAGEWRDSTNGIGGGRYPYDVNAVLAPAALDATARLLDSHLLDPFLSPEDRTLLSNAAAAAKVWHAEAPRLFTVTVDNASAAADITAYAAKTGVPAQDAINALGGNPVTFPAVALDAAGTPIPIVHSDAVFDLLFGESPPDVLDGEVADLARPFPLGLQTGAGMVVADPVFADPQLQARFTNHDYHGTVIWSWVQAAYGSGLERQLARTDLPQPVRDHLLAAQRTLWRGIDAAAAMRSSELWSWRYDNGFRVAPFGTGTDVTEANAAQLWSSVYLAVKPPTS